MKYQQTFVQMSVLACVADYSHRMMPDGMNLACSQTEPTVKLYKSFFKRRRRPRARSLCSRPQTSEGETPVSVFFVKLFLCRKNMPVSFQKDVDFSTSFCYNTDVDRSTLKKQRQNKLQ